jgi:ATP-dependent Clp protease adapter protein ClpS
MTEILLQCDVQERTIESGADEATVLVHDDGVTPCHFVILLLRTTFELSDELAEHIAWVAQATGTAPVVTRPRSEARRLVHRAHVTARLYGAPLTFSLEQEPSTPPQESRKPLIPFIVSGIILLCTLLLAVSLALADGAGDTEKTGHLSNTETVHQANAPCGYLCYPIP